jgi:predicted O-linked N-acetylglucosamine transferase (SPINDLY family)
MDLPDYLIAKTVDVYVAAAVELAENHATRIGLRSQLIKTQALNKIFKGDAKAFGKQLSLLIKGSPKSSEKTKNKASTKTTS